MSGQLLIQERDELVRIITAQPSILKRRGQALAQAEYDYKVAFAKKLLYLRESGEAISIARDLALGDSVVAELRRNRDIKDVLYRSALESININKLKLKIVETQIEREYKG